MRRQPIIRATALVALFWWSVFTLWEAGFNLRDLILSGKSLDWHWSIVALVAVAGGTFCGIFASAFSIWFDHRERDFRLLGRQQHGISSTIGVVPLHYSDLRDDIDEEDVQELTPQVIASVPEINKERTADFLDRWHAKFDKSHPKHAALMYGIETIMMRYRSLPATHVAGGHGGRSLLVHSLLVCWYMDKLAPHHTYDGKIKLPDFTITLPLKNENYEFEPDDPLIAMIGLAHDIGKIECYEFDKRGQLQGCRPDHDLTGSRIVSRMAEFWDLPAEDRDVLHTVLAFYHHPQDVPSEDGFRVRDDRLHALLELLIKADTLASRREAGESAKNAMAALESTLQPASVDEGAGQKPGVDLWAVIQEVLSRPNALNGDKTSGNLGFKRRYPQQNADFIFLIESDFIEAVCAEAEIENTIQKTTNPVSSVTKLVLNLLDSKGCLYTEQHSGGRNAESALYKVDFFNEKAYWADKTKKKPADPETRGTPTMRLASCIVIYCEPHFPDAARLQDFKLVPVIGNSRLGGRGKRAGKSIADAAAEAAVTGEMAWEGVNLDTIKSKTQEQPEIQDQPQAEEKEEPPPPKDQLDQARAKLLLGVKTGKLSSIASNDFSDEKMDSDGNYIVPEEQIRTWLSGDIGGDASDRLLSYVKVGHVDGCRQLGSYVFIRAS